MKPTPLFFAALATALAASACEHHDVNLGGSFHEVCDVPPEETGALDILFVVDDSGSMQPHQQALIQSAASSLFAELEDDDGNLPDLHVGVASTDVTVPGYSIPTCDNPDDGYLRGPQASPACQAAGITGSFLVDTDDGAGGRNRNYSGAIGDAFACLADLGTSGCGFESPLQSMRLALDGRNPGFLRDDAMLLVVLLTDEDDCSVSDPSFYDPTQFSLTDPLGPLASFRCFDFGVRCDPDDPRTPGSKSGCESREDSDYLTPVADFTSFLGGLKADPTKVMVGGIFGDAEPVTVLLSADGQKLELGDVCGSAPPACSNPDAGAADASVPVDAGPPADAGPACPAWGPVSPGVRLHTLAEAFPARYDFESICQVNFSAMLRRIARATAGVMRARPCLLGQVADLDPATAGVQASCRAYDVTAPRTAGEQRTELRACDGSGALPCFRVVADAATCGDTDTNLAVQVDRDGAAPAGAHVVLECQ